MTSGPQPARRRPAATEGGRSPIDDNSTPARSADGSAPHPAVAELGRISLGELSMEAVLHRVAELARAALDDIGAASVTLIKDGRAATAAQTDPVALVLDEAQYDAGDGPCLEAARQDGVVVSPDLAAEARWPAFTRAAQSCQIRSALAAGIVHEAGVSAALNVYASEPDALGPAQVAAAETFASYAAVTLTNAARLSESRRLADQLSEAMASRAVIEQAKGILVAQRAVSPEEAFRMLAAASQSSNRKLRDIAQAMVDGAVGDGGARPA